MRTLRIQLLMVNMCRWNIEPPHSSMCGSTASNQTFSLVALPLINYYSFTFFQQKSCPSINALLKFDRDWNRTHNRACIGWWWLSYPHHFLVSVEKRPAMCPSACKKLLFPINDNKSTTIGRVMQLPPLWRFTYRWTHRRLSPGDFWRVTCGHLQVRQSLMCVQLCVSYSITFKFDKHMWWNRIAVKIEP